MLQIFHQIFVVKDRGVGVEVKTRNLFILNSEVCYSLTAVRKV